MKIRYIIFTLLLLTSVSSAIYGQTDIEGLKIYGFYQTDFVHQENTMAYPVGPAQDVTLNSFWLQQMNIFLSKDINDYFSTFVNLEFTNTYSSQKNWGSFSIQEAWIRYSKSNLLNVKAGLLIPSFNNLNEIKNRTILLPYVFRPFVYETTIGAIIPINTFVPSTANLQVYGMIPVQDLKLNYAVYVGNSEDSYVKSNLSAPSAIQPSMDSSKFKMVGGRFGLDYNNLKLGVSSTYDRTTASIIGTVPRVRFGADFSFAMAGFKLESEYIKVSHYLTDGQSAKLVMIHNYVSPMVTTTLDKQFYYAVLTYNITDDWYVYGKYDYLKDESSPALVAGVKGYSFGGGFKPTDDVLLKVQYQDVELNAPGIINFGQKAFYVGASIFF